MGPLHPTPVDATSHSAVRSFSAPWTLPDGSLEVTITTTGYGALGQVVETLPTGFSYEGSETAASVDGQTVAFTLLGATSFTYAVIAPSAEVSYSSPASCWTRTRLQSRLAALPASGSVPPPRRRQSPPRRNADVDTLPLNEVRTNSATNQRAALLQEYIGYIQRIPPGQAGKLEPGDGERTQTVRRRLNAAAEALGKDLEVRRSANAVYFCTPDGRRRGRVLAGPAASPARFLDPTMLSRAIATKRCSTRGS